MIRKLRRRIILINMLLMGVVMLGIFTAVIVNNYSGSVRTLERGMDRLLGEGFEDNASPPPDWERGRLDATDDDSKPLRFEDGGMKEGDVPMEITSYIIVTLNENGVQTASEAKNITMDAENLKACVALATEHSGQLGDYGLMYVTRNTMDGKKIVFAPNSSIYSDLRSSLLICGLLFLGSMTVIFFISLFLSGLAVKPVKKAWEQQKQFVADASHELKTPLTVILANNNIMLSHQNATVADERQWLESTEEEANHMKKLINNMLFLAKSDAGTTKIQLSEVDFSEIVEGCALNFEPVAFERAVLIDTDIAPELTLQGDATQLNQLAHILIDNAVKYAADDSTVTILLKRAGEKIRFSVNNKGSVIAREDMEHLFDRFYRAEKSRTTKGYGLGLSIAQRIVESMNGRIAVESNETEGTTFTVILSSSK